MAADAAVEEGDASPLDAIEEHEYPDGLRLTAIVVALVLSIFLASLDTVVFLLGILIFEIGSLICALAPNSDAFIAGRAVTGTGCASVFAGCFIIISLSSRPKIRPAMTSSLSATFAVASVVGPLIGGAFTQNRLQGERALIMPSFLRNRVLVVGAIFEFFIAGCFNLALFYLPIYFQAVRGVWLIPVILSLTITQIVVGGLITATGIHNPFLIVGPALAAVGSGLFMLLAHQSSAGRWIGFQIVLGIGVGFCLTIPLMLSQVAVKTSDVSTATSISMGSAFLLPTAQSVFQNQLLKALRLSAPDIDPSVVLSAGASSEAISSLPSASLGGIIQSYTNALRFAFAIGIPFAGIACFVSFFMPWFRYQDASKASKTGTTASIDPEKKNGVKPEDGKE
ncbi:hypothetical protein PG985_011401 [Apiospora marii]|uniref:uncharacterized protein n=1 Tax=Apiospora marii TaxID=335849 RepID=UPI00312EB10E